MSILEKIALSLGLSVSAVISDSIKAPRRYKVFYIDKKKAGEKREIAQPTKRIKEIQRWILVNVLNNMPVHSAARAYVKDGKLVENVNPHVGNSYVLKLDFSNFFNSMKDHDFMLLAKKENWNYIDAVVIARYLFWRKNRSIKEMCLSVGAPSSPCLSNILMYSFDCALSDFLREKNVAYTRYADDITLSSCNVKNLSLAEDFIKEYILKNKSPRLMLNHEKRRFISEKSHKKITGLTVNLDGGITVSKKIKKNLRAGFYTIKTSENPDVDEVRKFIGYLSFYKSIDSEGYISIVNKYGFDVVIKAQSIIKKFDLK